MTAHHRAAALHRLHADPDILVLPNVWDVATARQIADLPGCRAVATASAAIAAAFGYPDGEQIPLDLVLDMTRRIVEAVPVPVTADLEAGYGDVATTVRRAVQAGVVGVNLEDAMRPQDESAAAIRTAVATAEAEGVPLVLNARTDAYLRGGDRDPEEVFRDAVTRGRAYLEEGATCVFVPGCTDPPTLARLVEALGTRRLSVLGNPQAPPPAELARLGVARVSYGPHLQRHLLDALARTGTVLLSGRPWRDADGPH